MTVRIIDLLLTKPEGQEVVVKGWVRTKRGNKNVAFIALNDGSTINNIQIVVDMATADEALLKDVTTGACLCVKGKLVESVGSGQPVEVQATEIEIYGREYASIEVTLSDYLVYVDKGDDFEASEYYKGASLEEVDLSVNSNVNTKKKGVYYVDYIVSQGTVKGKSRLVVVVQ